MWAYLVIMNKKKYYVWEEPLPGTASLRQLPYSIYYDEEITADTTMFFLEIKSLWMAHYDMS